MTTLDWLFVIIPILALVIVGGYVRRFVRSVADFMAGGRNAGRYLLSTARSEMNAGAALFVASFEQFSRAGYAINWWNQILVPVGLIVAISGFVVYRYRQTRALTLAQFFEMRYTRNFRLYAGVLGFLSGIVNFGVIPAVGARFFVYFLRLPQDLVILNVSVPTYLPLMTLFLGITMLLTMTGGQITVLITDCLGGMISQIFYVVIAAVMICLFTWADMREVLLNQPAGESLINPFETGKVKDFNIWFILMLACTTVYGTMAWQNAHAFNASAATPHDSRMGAILGRWRWFASGVMVTILAMCTLTFLQHPHYAAGAAEVQGVVDQIANPSVRAQMHWPIALSYILPSGIKGMLCAIILMGVISGDGMHLHSWGSILIQDVVVPLRKKPLTVTQHLSLLRWAIFGVAVFAFCFGIAVKNTDKLLLWWAVTQAIFVGGAGIAIIGGLYWSRGTAAGAWAGMVTGSVLATGGILLRQPFIVDCAQWLATSLNVANTAVAHTILTHLGYDFPLNGMQLSFFASITAVLVYITVSVLTCRAPHNMDKLLHRGQYAVENTAPAAAVAQPRWYEKIIGMDGNFTRADRWITLSISGWSFFWFFVFIFGTLLYLWKPWSNETWAVYWHATQIWVPLIIGIGTAVWFTIGCVRDLKDFFRRLRVEKVDDTDDGTVRH